MPITKNSVIAFVVLILIGTLAILYLQSESESVECARAREFSKHRTDLYELQERLLQLNKETGITGYITRMGDERDLVTLSAGHSIPLQKVVDQQFAAHKEALIRIKSIVDGNSVEYVNVETGNSVWVTMSGGGVLGVDYGYVWVNSGILPKDSKLKSCAIPDETKWFAFSR